MECLTDQMIKIEVIIINSYDGFLVNNQYWNFDSFSFSFSFKKNFYLVVLEVVETNVKVDSIFVEISKKQNG